MTARVLLATRSAGKLRELEQLFASHGFEAHTLDSAGLPERPDEQALETFDTFEENALAKARYFHALTLWPTVADDSGLAVDGLDGRPGVHSKRWSGRADLQGEELDGENNRLLVASLRDAADRGARYVCAAAFVDEGRELVRRGETAGRIVDEARGAGGFGYDPYFFSTELGCTFGEARLEDKQRVSHRGRAFRALLDAITSGARG